MKLKLTYVPSCLEVVVPHYDLHTNDKNPVNIACIATDKNGAKLIREWIKQYNEGK